MAASRSLTFGSEALQPADSAAHGVPAPGPGGSACCYWNGYGRSASTRLKDAPTLDQPLGQNAAEIARDACHAHRPLRPGRVVLLHGTQPEVIRAIRCSGSALYHNPR